MHALAWQAARYRAKRDNETVHRGPKPPAWQIATTVPVSFTLRLDSSPLRQPHLKLQACLLLNALDSVHAGATLPSPNCHEAERLQQRGCALVARPCRSCRLHAAGHGRPWHRYCGSGRSGSTRHPSWTTPASSLRLGENDPLVAFSSVAGVRPWQALGLGEIWLG